jgi:hypothetical protein
MNPQTHNPSVECRCAGEPYEMGFQQGRALRQRILDVRHRLHDLEAVRLERPRWMPFPLFVRLAEARSASALIPALQRQMPSGLARLKGIAAGAKVPLRSLCLMNALEAFVSSMKGRTVSAPLGACSCVAVRRSHSDNGEPMVAKNFDYLPLLQPFQLLRECRPRTGWRSLEFAFAPQAGAVDGVNEQGLCITLDYAFAVDAGAPAPLITMLIGEALARCASVSEAADFLMRQPRWGAGMLMLADASGELASLELTNTRAAIRRPAAGQDWLLHTNVCRCPDTCAVQVPEAAVFSDRVPQVLRGKPVLRWHEDRARRLEELVLAQKPVGPDRLAAIMADHGPTGAPDGTSPCVHTDYWRTTACLQWFPARRSVKASYSTACEADYVEVSL